MNVQPVPRPPATREPSAPTVASQATPATARSRPDATGASTATNSGGLIFFPLLFLTPNFVPRDMLTRPMEIAATLNPVTYVMETMRSLILYDLEWNDIWPGFLVVAVTGAIMVVVSTRMINNYD